jgi:hypothetical protein
LERKNVSVIRDWYHYARAVIRRKKPLFGARSLKSLIHFSQTHHSTQYLQSCGITPIPLIDSINEDFLNDNYKQYISSKKDIILFNPTKGKQFTDRLIAAYPEYDFVPLKGYSPSELSNIFYSAKLYIDFGSHPGRDRMPREAAIHGCCVITGRLGSAANDVDLPIPSHYKIDTANPEFVQQFGQLSRSIFNQFSLHSEVFEEYRNYLKQEPIIFKQQIADYFLGQ